MKVDKILPCVCSVPVDFITDSSDGMPRLVVNHGQYYSCYCPRCGRGSELPTHKSQYLALKYWNRIQEWCYDYEGKDINNYEVDYEKLYGVGNHNETN